MMSQGTSRLLVVDKAHEANGILSLVAINHHQQIPLSNQVLVDPPHAMLRIKMKMLDHLGSWSSIVLS